MFPAFFTIKRKNYELEDLPNKGNYNNHKIK